MNYECIFQCMKYIVTICLIISALQTTFCQLGTKDTLIIFDYTNYQESISIINSNNENERNTASLLLDGHYFELNLSNPISISKSRFLELIDDGLGWTINKNAKTPRLMVITLEINKKGKEVVTHKNVTGLNSIDIKNDFQVGDEIRITKTQLFVKFSGKPVNLNFAFIIM